MKKLLSLLLFIVTTNSYAQLTLEHDYTASIAYGQFFSVVYLTSGPKYATFDPNTITLYNIDHSLYKTLNIPGIPAGARAILFDTKLITETLFNNDTLIEYLSGAQDTVTYTLYPMRLLNEAGSVLMTFPNYLGGYSPSIINVGGTDFKLAVRYTDSSSGIAHEEIYSLPGTLECNACGGFVGINLPQVTNSFSSIYPNPATNRVKISYDLQVVGAKAVLHIINTTGQVIQVYNLGPAFNDIEIDTSIFPAGVYHYVISGERNKTSGTFIIE